MKISTDLTKLSFIALSVLYSATSIAALAEKQGFTGEIAIITGYADQTSNLNTEGEKIKTGNLNTKGISEGGGLVAPLASLQYTFGSELDKQVFIGTSQDDVAVGDLAFELGYSQGFNSGMVISASFLPGVMEGDTWQDPYLLDVEKQVTDESGNAVRFKVDAIAGSNFSLDLAYGTTEIDSEQSGSDYSLFDQELLDRNGSSVYLKSAYQYAFNETTILIPSITYISHFADGDAMSFDSLGGDLTYFKMLGRHTFVVTAAYSHSSFGEINPVFNETREDNAVSIFTAYQQVLGFGLDNWSFVSLVGYNKSVSNIEFYDEEGLFVSIGGKYNF
jgi:hypothetical protein